MLIEKRPDGQLNVTIPFEYTLLDDEVYIFESIEQLEEVLKTNKLDRRMELPSNYNKSEYLDGSFKINRGVVEDAVSDFKEENL